MWGNAIAIAGVILVSVTAVFGLIVQFIRSLSPQEYHDRQSCMCFYCRKARYEAMRKLGHKPRAVREDGTVVWAGERPREGFGPDWTGTAQLSPRMVVTYNDDRYLIREVRTDIKGYVVALKNLKTKNEFVMVVPWKDANRRWWRREIS